MEMNKIFKGILQVKALPAQPEAGVIYFVRERGTDDQLTGNAKVYFGSRLYGEVNETKLAELDAAIKANASAITENADAIALINTTLGEWSKDLGTVAEAVVLNKTAIATLNGKGEGSVAKAVADAKTALVNGASEGYDTLSGLETKIKAVAQSVEEKNVDAEGDEYVTASAEGNKVTVAASETTKASLALADSALQKADIAEGTTNGTISVEGTDVKVHGLGSAAYTDSSAYDVSGAAATVKTELLGTTKEGDATTIAALNTKIEGVAADAKSYSVVAVTGDELSGLGANVKEAYKLVDEDSAKVGEYIKIYKDSALQKVELKDQELEFTYLLADGTTSVVPVDVSAFLAESEFKNGLQVVDHVVSVKVDSTSESFLSVGENGVKVSGIQDAINTATSGKADSSVVTAHTGDADIHVTTADKEKWNKAEENANAYTNTQISGVNETITTISGKVDNNTTAITAETNARKEAVSALTEVVNDKLDKATHEAYTASTKSVLDTIQESLSSITKDAVVSIASSGKTINVTEENGAVNVEVNTLAHTTTGQEGYVILNNVDGALYGVMYYGGDDVE